MHAAGVFGEDEIEHLRAAVDEGVAQTAVFAEWADGFKKLRSLAFDKSGEERGLAGVAGIERLLGGAGAMGDLTHAGAFEALVEEDLSGDVEQALGARSNFLGRRAATSGFPLSGGRLMGRRSGSFPLGGFSLHESKDSECDRVQGVRG
jgi:hypothetical protein